MARGDFGPIERILNATRYSLKGLCEGWRTQPALRYEFYILLVAVPVAWVIGTNGGERALLIGSCLQVVIVELINSAIETVVDRIGSEQHDLSGRAKDLGSAAVFFSLVLAVIVWLLVLFG
jgi:diacylglycerol kinase (ATP)